MKKYLLSLLLVLALTACGNKSETPQKNEKPTIKIGVSLPLSGDMGHIGNVLKGGVEIAQQDLQKRNLKHDYQFIIEDNSFEIKRVALINQKFISVDKVDAIIDFASKIGLVTNPIAENNKIIHLSVCASDPKVADGKYNFIHGTQPEGEVERLVEKIIEDKLDNIVIFATIDQATIKFSETIQQQLKKHGIKFKEYRTNPGEKDFNFLINRIVTENPGLYIVLEYSPALDIILKRLKENSNTAPVTAVETFNILDDKNLIEGEWFVDAAEIDKDNYKRFADYNKTDNLYGAGNIYDAVMLLVEAFEKATDKLQAVEELSAIKTYKGIVGDLRQDENGIFNSKAILKKIINGQSVTIEE